MNLIQMISVAVLLPRQEEHKPLKFLQQCEVPLEPTTEGNWFEQQLAITDFWIKHKKKLIWNH